MKNFCVTSDSSLALEGLFQFIRVIGSCELPIVSFQGLLRSDMKEVQEHDVHLVLLASICWSLVIYYVTILFHSAASTPLVFTGDALYLQINQFNPKTPL